MLGDNENEAKVPNVNLMNEEEKEHYIHEAKIRKENKR